MNCPPERFSRGGCDYPNCYCHKEDTMGYEIPADHHQSAPAATCRGSLALGTGCGHCSRCAAERRRMQESPVAALQAKVDAANLQLSLVHVNTRAWEEWIRGRWEKGDQPERNLAVMSLGLGGEAGEVADLVLLAALEMRSAAHAQEHLKKFIRDGKNVRDELVLELGDVLHYLTRIGQVFGIDLMEMMMENKRKLEQRDRDRRLAAARASLDKPAAAE